MTLSIIVSRLNSILTDYSKEEIQKIVEDFAFAFSVDQEALDEMKYFVTQLRKEREKILD